MLDLSPLDNLDFRADAPSSRREALHKVGKLGAGLALFSLPAFLRPKVSFAQDAGLINILNYALTLEYLEAFYYTEAVNLHEDLFPTGDELAVFDLIATHENSHVDFLRTTIDSLGGDPVEFTREDFDYTAGEGTGLGPFNPFEEYEDFLVLSQAFEDTGVSAYKGQAAQLIDNDDVLTAALQIHSVEARHAAEVRRLRDLNEFAVIDPWITLDRDGGAPAEIYANEDNVTQAGVNLTTLGPYSAEEASAAFDEPLTMEQVIAIADPFSSQIGDAV